MPEDPEEPKGDSTGRFLFRQLVSILVVGVVIGAQNQSVRWQASRGLEWARYGVQYAGWWWRQRSRKPERPHV